MQNVSEQLYARGNLQRRATDKKWRNGRQSGRLKFLNTLFELIRQDESRLLIESNERLAVALDDGKFDERGGQNRREQAASHASKNFSRLYNIQLHGVAVGAKRR
jgi:hypothetical protein